MCQSSADVYETRVIESVTINKHVCEPRIDKCDCVCVSVSVLVCVTLCISRY